MANLRCNHCGSLLHKEESPECKVFLEAVKVSREAKYEAWVANYRREEIETQLIRLRRNEINWYC